ncbi:hypothetical protein SPRG_07748 [Saprolegnia parasitica CBS 223.65]|uniref:Uncharacterized protein n=1 Tax=Saprolegnia parasitica (strain CBS 223.65) TaxID=695850 RepID=A0A067CKE8_SAPPC|nr:hypothetical protein SPRG_07748 [Saprolegnia parasitica CBS 223.65]KDO27036.1 hypothetical protein SPRG_07748 [Saprolegnia parasitica CBS 223.65]|eukprot:XP_012202132.1 hypothetical protein SPRG_07748 [Saprolegnia parasitica CBS 223.65]
MDETGQEDEKVFGRSNSVTKVASLLAGGASVPKSNKEARALEALAMKDEQLRILSEQNNQLLNTLNNMDDELQSLKMAKLQLEDDNRSLRDSNFELQSRARPRTRT